ncbi:1-pyrroline-5-carboxylate dehydrogenase [Vibrio ziniensis]|uniref:1-pyrroline-5-carboxylate dehydrogenase n=1 Tax=Vibrio ziniensis TaxID=2711221 RepID=A0A6G7CJ42_9VIBR|nr:1-pyrroline-5-carboxylate dehydrogenase [Vibrio ziniensis]QIH42090.1 1-pyrroline-5-carboxylate dehydrogenase [Vibrio ziniensis]
MSQQIPMFDAAKKAFEDWYLSEPQARCLVLETLKKKVPSELVTAYDYQLSFGKQIVENCQSLISPTGETNDLYIQGRGVAVLLIDSADKSSRQATIAMLVSMLIAGNSVVACTDDKELTKLFSNLAENSEMPANLLQVCSRDNYSALIHQDIRNFALIGNSQTAIEINKELAAKPNAITSLVSETDLITLPNSKDPMLTLRFATERVRTINITAIGGNAMLMELGSDKH